MHGSTCTELKQWAGDHLTRYPTPRVHDGPPDLCGSDTDRGLAHSAPDSTAGLPRFWHNFVPAVLLVVLFDAAAAGERFMTVRAVSLIFVLTVPGGLTLTAAKIRTGSPVVRLGLSMATSALILMLSALVASALLPPLGVRRPLAHVPMVIAVDLVVLVTGAACASRGERSLAVFDVPSMSTPNVLVLLVLALLPLASMGGAEALNNGRSSILAVAALLAAGLVIVALLTCSQSLPTGSVSAGLFCIGLAILYSYSMRSSHLFGFDIQAEYQSFVQTFRAGRWTPPTDGNAYGAMLSITALPAVLARVSGVSGLYVFKMVYPAFFAFVPVFTFEVARRWLPCRAALVGALYLVVLPQFGEQFSAIARQELGLLFFAAMLILMLDDALPSRCRQAAVSAAITGLVVSHYSTSYVAVAILLATYVLFRAIRLFGNKSTEPRSTPVVTLTTVLLALGLILVWDVGVTHSTNNVTQFVNSVAERGPDVLPNGAHGSIISRWINGNVGSQISTAEYYNDAKIAAKATEPWLNAYPRSAWARFPLAPASIPTLPARAPDLAPAAGEFETVCAELLLLVTVVGTLGALRRGGGNRTRPPFEISLLGLMFLLFVAFMRVSGVAAASYNQERGTDTSRSGAWHRSRPFCNVASQQVETRGDGVLFGGITLYPTADVRYNSAACWRLPAGEPRKQGPRLRSVLHL